MAVGGGAGGGSACVSVTNDCGRSSVAPLRVSGDATGNVTDPMYTVWARLPRGPNR